MVEDDDISMDGEEVGPSDPPMADPYGRTPLSGRPGKVSLGYRLVEFVVQVWCTRERK